jgi:hypothetical protein
MSLAEVGWHYEKKLNPVSPIRSWTLRPEHSWFFLNRGPFGAIYPQIPWIYSRIFIYFSRWQKNMFYSSFCKCETQKIKWLDQIIFTPRKLGSQKCVIPSVRRKWPVPSQGLRNPRLPAMFSWRQLGDLKHWPWKSLVYSSFVPTDEPSLEACGNSRQSFWHFWTGEAVQEWLS